MWDRRAVYPVSAAGITLAVTWPLARGGGSLGAGSLLAGLLPLVVPTVWGAATLCFRSLGWQLLCVVIWAVVTAAGFSLGAAVSLLAYVVAGVGLGWALARRWRNDRVLWAAALPIAVVSFWATSQLPVDQMLADGGREFVTAFKASWADSALSQEQQVQLAYYERSVERIIATLAKLWPGILLIGIMAQVGIVHLVVRWLAVSLKAGEDLRPLPAFHLWRVPFYWIWALVAGLALIAVRGRVGPRIGVNVIIVALSFLSVQGLSVQIHVMGRMMPPWVRILFWGLAAVFLAPLIVLSSALLGVVDQWLDMRRLGVASERGAR